MSKTNKLVAVAMATVISATAAGSVLAQAADANANAQAATPEAESFARLAHEETGYGVVADKIQKNLFASDKVYRFIRPMKTVGVIARHDDRRHLGAAVGIGAGRGATERANAAGI